MRSIRGMNHDAAELRARDVRSGRFGGGSDDRSKRGVRVMPGGQAQCLPAV